MFRKFFYRKPPDGLLEIAERVYVFDCCFTTDVVEDENYKSYVGGIADQIRGHLPDASFMMFNFREGDNQSQIANILSEYDMTVIDYPRQYEGCPLLTVEMINYCLRSGDSWLLLGQRNVLLMHCERGGWPILAFILAALLLYRNIYNGEQKTLDMIHRQAPRELLQLMSPLNPLPSQLRYLQYISRRSLSSEWPPSDRVLMLDCIILRHIPNVDGEGGCRPIIRIYGQDSSLEADRTTKVLFSTPKRSKIVRYYKQAESELVKIDIHCLVQGDVVLECISLGDDLEREEMIFRIMFSTAFIRSNILILNRDEIDTLWNCKDQFSKDFRTEVLFSEMDSANSDAAIDLPVIEAKEGLPIEAFAKVKEIFSNVNWTDSKPDVALNVLQKLTASSMLKEHLENASQPEAKSFSLEEVIPGKLEEIPTSQVLDSILKSYPSKGMEKRTEEFSKEIDSLSGKKADINDEFNSSMLQQMSNQVADAGSHAVSSPQLLNEEKSSEASEKPKASELMIPEKQSRIASGPSLDENTMPKRTPSADSIPALQQPAQSKIISPRILQSSCSSFGSLLVSPKPMQRFQSSPPSLGITTVLHDHDTYKSDVVTHLEPMSAPASDSTVCSVPDMGKLGQHGPHPVPPAGTEQLGSLHVEPPRLNQKCYAPPPPLPFSRQSIVNPADDFTYSQDMPPDRNSTSRLAGPSSTPLEKPVAASPPPPPPPPPLPPSFTQSPSFSAVTTLSVPPPPPPPPPVPSFGQSSTSGITLPEPPPPPPPPFKQPPSSNTSISLSTPPPPPPSHVPDSVVSATDTGTCGKVKAPPPPPPPPKLSVSASSPALSSSAPPPPPPPKFGSKEVGSAPKTPPVPPPPMPSGKGLPRSNSSGQPQVVGANGPVPPPPGPPGVKGRTPPRLTPRSQSQSRKANLKPYHWLKLTRVMQGSLWAETQKSDEAAKAPEFDLSELADLFAASAPNSENGPGGKSSRRASGPKSDKVQLIELRRAYNCEIMLSKVKISLSDLLDAVLAMDDSALDVDQVENFIKFCPTKEEMELLKGYKGEKENLGKCELFFLELMKVPRVESKLRVFSFKMQFTTQLSDLKKNLQTVNSTSEEIRTSVKLKRVMQTILSLGNALNQGTARGSAVGFRLDSLLKLTDTRARNNKMTLMHYLCKVLAEKLPELLDFPKDLVSLEASTKVQLKFLAEEMQAISKGLEKVVQELTASGKDGPISENFCKILKQFLSYAEGEVRALASLYSIVGRNADALAMYFGEDPAKCPFEQVVSTLLNFVRMFIRAHDENSKQLELEKKKAEKEAENEKPKVISNTKDSEHHLQSPMATGP